MGMLPHILTDTKLKSLKPREKLYKVVDRDGLYVAVTASGTVSFRYDYRISGRRETVTIGRYGPDGISLAEAREELNTVKKQISLGVSPAAAKRDGKKMVKGAQRFSDYTVAYMKNIRLADSTRAMKQSVIDRDTLPAFGNRLMHELTPPLVREHCDKMVERGARATALQVREIISSVFKYAADRGHDVTNPVENIKASSIATFTPRDRALSPKEIGIFFRTLEHTGTMATLKLAVKLVLLTMVRKNEFIDATWDEVDFDKAAWVIPAGRMKAGRSHVIYLSRQALDIMIGLKMCAGGSDYLLAGRYDIRKTLSKAALNRVITETVKRAQAEGHNLEHSTVHDLRRTASTLLHEAGFSSDWIEKQLAHEQNGVRAVYNKAEYAAQRRDMLQQWADMVDGWVKI